MSDTDRLLVFCWSGAGCANEASKAEGVKCNVMDVISDRRSEGGLVVHCEKEEPKRLGVNERMKLVMQMMDIP
jgi:hypothetical protein